VNLRSLLRQPVLTVAFHETEARWTVGRGRRISSAGRVRLVPGMIVDGVIAAPADVAALLHDDAFFAGTGRMQTVAVVPAQRCIIRQIDVPHVTGKAFDEFVVREIRRELPMIGEHTHVSWRVVDTAEGTARVFVVGVARDVLDSHIDTLKEVGLTPMSADLRVIAAARSVGRPRVVIVHLEDQEVELGVFERGTPSIVRVVSMTAPCGEPAWTDQLTQELNRALKFYRDSQRHSGEDAATIPVCIVGGAARVAGVADAIRSATGHEVVGASPGIELPPAQDALRFAANVGAAMKDLAA
jgi:Tfp pilus assembly PilM family ATPase